MSEYSWFPIYKKQEYFNLLAINDGIKIIHVPFDVMNKDIF